MFQKTFANRAINLLNLHFGLFTLADSLINIFIAVYFYKVGIPLPGIFLSLGSINLVRVFLRPLTIKMSSTIGLRKTVIFGMLSFLPTYPLLGKIQGVDIWLILFIITAAIPYTFYWSTYHAYFSVLGDVEHRGKQIGMREICMQGGAVIAPLLGGVLLRIFGFNINIWSAMVIILFSTALLFWTPEVQIPPPLKLKEVFKKIGPEGFWIFFGNNVYLTAHDITWRLALFFLLKNYVSYGGLLSLAILLQMSGSFLVGSSFDRGTGKKLIPLGIGIMSLVILGRIFFAFSIPIIINLDFLFMLGYCLFVPIQDSIIYNLSRKSHAPFWFHILGETGADAGGMVTSLLAAAFLLFGGPLRLIMVLSIFGLCITGVALQKYFHQK